MPSFKMGLGGPISLKGDQVLNWIHMEDEVGIIEHVLSNSSISGPVNAVAPEIQTNREWAQKFAKGNNFFKLKDTFGKNQFWIKSSNK